MLNLSLTVCSFYISRENLRDNVMEVYLVGFEGNESVKDQN